MTTGTARTATLRVRLRPWLKDEVRRVAERRQLSISELVRTALLKEIGREPGEGPPENWRQNVRTR